MTCENRTVALFHEISRPHRDLERVLPGLREGSPYMFAVLSLIKDTISQTGKTFQNLISSQVIIEGEPFDEISGFCNGVDWRETARVVDYITNPFAVASLAWVVDRNILKRLARTSTDCSYDLRRLPYQLRGRITKAKVTEPHIDLSDPDSVFHDWYLYFCRLHGLNPEVRSREAIAEAYSRDPRHPHEPWIVGGFTGLADVDVWEILANNKIIPIHLRGRIVADSLVVVEHQETPSSLKLEVITDCVRTWDGLSLHWIEKFAAYQSTLYQAYLKRTGAVDDFDNADPVRLAFGLAV